MFATLQLWCVFQCACYDISVLNQSIVCVQHNRRSVSLPYSPHWCISHTLTVCSSSFFHFSGLLSLYLLLLYSLCQIHLTPGGNSPFIFLLQETVWQPSSSVSMCLTLCVCACVHMCVRSCPLLTFLADMIRFFQALHSAHFFPTCNPCAFASENVRACVSVSVFEAFTWRLVEKVSIVFFPLT